MAVTIACEFTSARPAAQVWERLKDVEGVASCLPGAQLDERVDDATHRGSLRVKLGPAAFRFKGEFRFDERDDAARRATATARGAADKGRGAVYARMRFHVEPLADDARSSRTAIEADVELSGMVAQFGRSSAMIQAVAQALVEDFARNLEQQMAQAPSHAVEDGAIHDPGPPASTTPAASSPLAAPATPQSLDGLRLLWLSARALLRRFRFRRAE
ncbi:SRPBCC family protein [Ramlibacter sp.]|uniref:SRPBCC family protein n=1 Tax=Ramlibacter sp. TaxID=1917967 RepID=UPI003D0C1BE2